MFKRIFLCPLSIIYVNSGFNPWKGWWPSLILAVGTAA